MNNSNSGDARSVWMEWRRERDRFLKHHYASPLPEEMMESFEALEYFEFDPELVFMATLQPADDETMLIVSSTGANTPYRVAGTIVVRFPDGPEPLVALAGEEDDIFIPFRDGTCGSGSYVGGRYLNPMEAPHGGLIVDFNRAINPYCAYDPDFSCPLPPPQNRLSLKIEAGERNFPAAG